MFWYLWLSCGFVEEHSSKTKEKTSKALKGSVSQRLPQRFTQRNHGYDEKATIKFNFPKDHLGMHSGGG